MAELHLQPDLVDNMAMSEGKVSRTIEKFGEALEPLESPEDLSEISDDLAAVKAIGVEKITTCGYDHERDYYIPHGTREVPEDMRSYRSRSPVPNGLNNGGVHSRSRSPKPASGQQIQQRSRNRALCPSMIDTSLRTIVQGVNAVVECCLKCFFARGDTNGKGHPFSSCPHTQAKHKQLAVALEATEVAVAVGLGYNQGGNISFCIDRTHMSQTEAFKCTLNNNSLAHNGKKIRVLHTKSYAVKALPYVRYPCVSCETSGRWEEARSHCALDCPAPTPETLPWIGARDELQNLYQKARANASESARGTKQPLTQPTKLQRPHVQQPVKPRARKLQAQQDRTPMHKAPYIHPARMPLHQHTSPGQEAMEHGEPHITWESAVLADMLHREMRECGGSWLDVALAVQGHLRQELMMEILHGDPAGGVPITIPLLSVLDCRVHDLKLQPQEW